MQASDDLSALARVGQRVARGHREGEPARRRRRAAGQPDCPRGATNAIRPSRTSSGATALGQRLAQLRAVQGGEVDATRIGASRTELAAIGAAGCRRATTRATRRSSRRGAPRVRSPSAAISPMPGRYSHGVLRADDHLSVCEGHPRPVRRDARCPDDAVGVRGSAALLERAVPEHAHESAGRIDRADARGHRTCPERGLAQPPVHDRPVPARERRRRRPGERAERGHQGDKKPSSPHARPSVEQRADSTPGSRDPARV